MIRRRPGPFLLGMALVLAGVGAEIGTAAEAPGNAERGQAVFAAKQCVRCHAPRGQPSVGPVIEELRRPQGAYELAGRFWNHAPAMFTSLRREGIAWPEISPAETARSRGLPWSVLRVVGDAWDEDLPPFLIRAQRRDGSVARGRVAFGAVVVPSRIPVLVRLASRVRRASERLADGAAAIMSEAAA